MLQGGKGQVRPVGFRIASEGVDDVDDDVIEVGLGGSTSGTSPEKVNVRRQRGQLRCRGVQSLKRIASGICDERGWISLSRALLLLPEPPPLLLPLLMRYLLVSSPRHSARRVMSVPAIGAQSRSTGGSICLWR